MPSSKILFISLIIISCAEPEVIIPPLEVTGTGKVLLIEELTGVRCPNCPSADARIESIETLYGKNLVVVNIHGNLLTKPLDESMYDFRNPFAIEVEEAAKPFIGKPSILINRTLFPEFSLKANPLQDQWQPLIEKALEDPQKLSIFATIEETGTSSEIAVGVLMLEAIDSELFLHGWLIEDKIIDAQEDVDKIILDYEHDHVLRAGITNINGVSLGNNHENESIINEQLTLQNSSLDPIWDKENLSIVLFVSDAQGVVIQAHKLRLIS